MRLLIFLARITFVMERNDKGTRQRTGEVEIDVRSPVVGHIALLDDPFLLEGLMSKLIGPQDLVFLLLSPCTLTLTSDIVQVALVSLELPDKICVVVADRSENLIELLGLDNDTFLQRPKVLQFLLNFIPEKAKRIRFVNDLELLQLAE